MKSENHFVWSVERFVANVLCLELANTIVHPLDIDLRHDRISTISAAENWASAVLSFGIADAEFDLDRPPETASINAESNSKLPNLLTLRAHIDRVFRPSSTERYDYLKGLGALLRSAAKPVETLISDGDRIAVEVNSPLGQVAGLAALSAIRLIATLPNPRIRQCPACDWLFLDQSRGGRRRWCDMAVCGNRQKARLHRRRRSGSVPC